MAAKKSEARYAHKKSREALRCRTTSWDDEVDLVLGMTFGLRGLAGLVAFVAGEIRGELARD